MSLVELVQCFGELIYLMKNRSYSSCGGLHLFASR